jgi:hypothetical protein
MHILLFLINQEKKIFRRHFKKIQSLRGPEYQKLKRPLHTSSSWAALFHWNTLCANTFLSVVRASEREGGRECVCSNQNLKRSLSSPLPSYTGTECKCRCTAGSRYQLVFQFRLHRHGDQQVLAKIYQLISHILCWTFKGSKEKNLKTLSPKGWGPGSPPDQHLCRRFDVTLKAFLKSNSDHCAKISWICWAWMFCCRSTQVKGSFSILNTSKESRKYSSIPKNSQVWNLPEKFVLIWEVRVFVF